MLNLPGRRGPIPPTRGPFVNTPLISLGKGKDGREQFWTSTWNHHLGCVGVVVDTAGSARRYTFTGDRFAAGFYSAAYAGGNVLWLCTLLSEVVRFDLESETFERYPTGAEMCLMFQGMALDDATGKLFALAHPPPVATAFVFDTRGRQSLKVERDICPDKYMRCSWQTSDGIWHAIANIPGVSLLHWNPLTDELRTERLLDSYNTHGPYGFFHLLRDGDQTYLPRHGWYGPDGFADDPRRPAEEADWIGIVDGVVYGVQNHNDCTVCTWNLETGEVRHMFKVEDSIVQGFALTADGCLASVSVYGEFRLFELPSGALVMSRWIDPGSVQHVDNIQRVTHDRVIGTPFITQRFWEVDLATGEGQDCGRAAPDGGQVNLTWRLGELSYWASYTTGCLMEYDPRQPTRYPENPRQVARPPHAMRPIAAAEHGRHLYYSSNSSYGKRGCVLAAYDTHTGTLRHRSKPAGNEAITSLWHVEGRDLLLAATTIEADARSAEPEATCSSLLVLSANTLEPIEQVDSLPDTTRTEILGPLDGHGWLVTAIGPDSQCLGTIRDDALAAPSDTWQLDADQLLYAGVPGWFLLRQGTGTSLWDMGRRVCLRQIHEDTEEYEIRFKYGDLFIVRREDFILIEDLRIHDITE